MKIKLLFCSNEERKRGKCHKRHPTYILVCLQSHHRLLHYLSNKHQGVVNIKEMQTIKAKGCIQKIAYIKTYFRTIDKLQMTEISVSAVLNGSTFNKMATPANFNLAIISFCFLVNSRYNGSILTGIGCSHNVRRWPTMSYPDIWD